MSDFSVKTLGGIAFQRDQGEFRPPTRKAAALLVYLGLSPRGSRSREHLAGVLWGRSADEQSRASLRQTLSSLRKALGEQADLLESDAEAVGIDHDRLAIDALEFERLSNSADQADLDRAADLYQGTFLEGFSLKEEGFEEWLAFTRQQYHEIALQLFVRLVEHYRMLQEYDAAVRYAQKLLALDPLREQTHYMLMELFARLGRREQALLQYDECERILKQELDVAPADETRELYTAIKTGASQHLAARTDDGHASRPQTEANATTAAGDHRDRRQFDKPVIVVLPFDNLSGDPGQDYLSAGITEDIITELSRFRSLSVIARSSSKSVKESEIDHLGIASQLAADYVVEGSVRRAGNTIRISAQLIEAVSGEHVWANRYDREIEDIFNVQDEVTRMIVATVGGRLEDHRVRSGGSDARDWSVYDLILRAQALHYRILKPSNEEAYAILARAQELDPDNARVHSMLGAVLLLDYTMSWSKSPAQTLDLALKHGRDAIRLDSLDSLAHARLGETLIHFGKFKEARRHFTRALELNPNDAESRALYSLYWVATGDAERALQELDTVSRIDPFERVWIPWFRGEALFMAQRYEEAIENFEEVTEPINDLRLTLSACYANSGDIETAKRLLCQYLANARQEMPNFPGTDLADWIEYVKSAAGYQNEDHHRLLIDALQKSWPDESELADRAPEMPKTIPPPAPSVAAGQAGKPSIAVLPFDNLSGDPTQQYLVDAITEDLVSNLAHDLWFDVIARTSTQKFRDNKAGIADIAAELGARYIVDGSLRKADDRVRVAVVLVDGANGRQIWNQRYDRVVTDLFELQDEIAISIAAAVIPEVNTAEQRSAMRKHPQNLDAWSCCHKAFAHLYTFELPELERAQSLFEQAIEHDPSYSQPYAGLAYSQMMTVWYDSSKKSLLDTANENARHAIRLDNRDSWAHFALGRILSMQGEYEEATLELERAIELNPSFGRAYFGLASVAVYSGNYEQALEPIDTAVRLSPADPHLWTFYNIKSRALVGLGQYEEAEYWARKAVRQPSATFWSDLALVSALGYLGREDEARLAIQELYRKKPGYSLEQYERHDFVLTPAAHQVVVEGLRRAGLPEREAGTLDAENRPSIAVLPFRNLGDDPEQIYFSDGVTEEVITALSRFRWLLVISSNSSFRYRQEQIANVDIAAELDVRYVVSGSVRKQENRVRVAAQLIDVATERHLWADRYDREIDNIFDVQDEIASNIISAVAPESLAAEIKRAEKVRCCTLDAWELIMQAHSHWRKLTREDNEQAKQLLKQATELEPDVAFAFSDLAFCHVFDSMFSWVGAHDESLGSAEQAARKAISIDDRDALGYMALGWVAHKKREQQAAEDAMNNAINRNPNLADAYGYLAMILGFKGDYAGAKEGVEQALRLSPHDPMKTFWYDALAMAAFMRGDYPLAVKWAEKAVEENASYVGALRVLAASYGQTGQLDEAKPVVDSIRKLAPNMTCAETLLGMPLRTADDQDRYIEGLRRAGLPE